MKLLKYELGPNVRAFSTYREGGVSQGTYASFNANEYCGDSLENVQQNRKIIAETLHIQTDNLIIPHQIHKTCVRTIESDFLTYSPNERIRFLEGVDALVTKTRGICLCVSTADCVPIVIYDTRGAIACIHAGWRGMYKHIIREAIHTLNSIMENDDNTTNKYVAIGPCIGHDSFEVGDEVYEAFAQAQFDMPSIAFKPDKPHAKWHIDLVEAAKQECIKNHVNPANIQACNIDTYTHANDFFSARKLGTQSGRILTGIILDS